MKEIRTYLEFKAAMIRLQELAKNPSDANTEEAAQLAESIQGYIYWHTTGLVAMAIGLLK